MYKATAFLGLGILFYIQSYFDQYDANPQSARKLSGTLRELHVQGSIVKSYSSPGSIAAVMNTAKTGTGGLFETFEHSWKCGNAPPVPKLAVANCEDDRRVFRTHWPEAGVQDIQNHRTNHPDGQCIIVTVMRSPATWFASMFLQIAKREWKPKEEMLQDYKEFLTTSEATKMMHSVLPYLLSEFKAGSLTEQAKIMDANGGYSFLGTAPSSSALTGCDLLFLRMEESNRWPKLFEMIDSDIHFKIGTSRIQQHPEAIEQIKAIAAYELSSEEKTSIYNRENDFIRDWFDAYGYMDDVKEMEVKDNAVSIS